MNNTSFLKNIERVYTCKVNDKHICFVILKTKSELVKKWEKLGLENLIAQDRFKRTMQFIFEEKKDCENLKKILYKLIWDIEV